MIKRTLILITLLLTLLPTVDVAAQANSEFCDSRIGRPTVCRMYRDSAANPGEPVGWAIMLFAHHDESAAGEWLQDTIEAPVNADIDFEQLPGMPADVNHTSTHLVAENGLEGTALFATYHHWVMVINSYGDSRAPDATMLDVFEIMVAKLPESGDPKLEYLPTIDEMPGNSLTAEDDWHDIELDSDATATTGTGAQTDLNTSETGQTNIDPTAPADQGSTTRTRRGTDASATETPTSDGVTRTRRGSDTSATETSTDDGVTRTRRGSDTSATETPTSDGVTRTRRGTDTSTTSTGESDVPGVSITNIEEGGSIFIPDAYSVTVTVVNESSEDYGTIYILLVCNDESGTEIGSGSIILEGLAAGAEREVPGVIAKVPGCDEVVPTISLEPLIWIKEFPAA